MWRSDAYVILRCVMWRSDAYVTLRSVLCDVVMRTWYYALCYVAQWCVRDSTLCVMWRSDAYVILRSVMWCVRDSTLCVMWRSDAYVIPRSVLCDVVMRAWFTFCAVWCSDAYVIPLSADNCVSWIAHEIFKLGLRVQSSSFDFSFLTSFCTFSMMSIHARTHNSKPGANWIKKLQV